MFAEAERKEKERKERERKEKEKRKKFREQALMGGLCFCSLPVITKHVCFAAQCHICKSTNHKRWHEFHHPPLFSVRSVNHELQALHRRSKCLCMV